MMLLYTIARAGSQRQESIEADDARKAESSGWVRDAFRHDILSIQER